MIKNISDFLLTINSKLVTGYYTLYDVNLKIKLLSEVIFLLNIIIMKCLIIKTFC